jgi:hypothetical protein
VENFLDVLKNPDLWMHVECGDIMPALQFLFKSMPETARIYYNEVSQQHDVTPHDESSIQRLRDLPPGHFFVLIYPQSGWEIAAVIVAIVIIAAVVAMAVLFQPKVPNAAMRSNQNRLMGSTNNELSQRTNEARPNGRIEDVVGKLRASPSMITVPFSRYIDNEEVEDAVMCIGRGSYSIHDARDGETSIYEIPRTSLQIYRPDVNINSGAPYFQIGPQIPDPAVYVTRSNSINGQELKAGNAGAFNGSSNICFEYPNIIRLHGNGNFLDHFVPHWRDNEEYYGSAEYFRDDTQYLHVSKAEGDNTAQRVSLIIPNSDSSFLIPFESDEQVAIYNNAEQVSMASAFFADAQGAVYNLSGTYNIVAARKIMVGAQYFCEVGLRHAIGVNMAWALINDENTVPGGAFITHVLVTASSVNFNGQYEINAMGEDWIAVRNPQTVNAGWEQLQYMENRQSALMSPSLSKGEERWIGPFVLENPIRTHISCNFAAPNGMYKDDGKNQSGASVEIEVMVTPVNLQNQPTGVAATWRIWVSGTAQDRDSKGATLYVPTPTVGRIRVQARRITPEDRGFQGSVNDTVKWKDLYGVNTLREANFGNVTMIRLRQWATTGAMAVKERKLNLLVTRELPRRISGSTFSAELYPTTSAADILCALALDPKIGNRKPDEIDFDNIYNTLAAAAQYFGTPKAVEFAYTFDKLDLSFEDTVNMIAGAAFCTAYRRGSVLRLHFERKNDQSALLFNHRNKLPGSETRTFSFGWEGDHDGIEYEYISPADDASMTIYLPQDRSAIKPKRYDSVGIRSKEQGWLHAQRLFNRMRYQHLVTEFTGTQESFLLLLGDRVLVADNTRAKGQDGEITAQNGLILTLSQKAGLEREKEYNCFLQLPDGTVESIRAYPGNTPYEILLHRPPRLPLVLEANKYARTAYSLSESSDADIDAFLVTELDYKDNFTAQVSAVNYDERYYANDKDFINGLIPPE